MGDQQFNVQKQAQDEAFRRDKLAQEQADNVEQVRLKETQLALDHAVDMAQVIADLAKATMPPPGPMAKENAPADATP